MPPSSMTDGVASDFSGMGKVVAMNRAGFGDLTGSGGEGVFPHFDSNAETKVMFAGVGNETSVYFGGGSSGNNTQVIVGPYVTWNFQGTVQNNNTVGTTVNVPYYELGANTSLGGMPMGIFDTYQDHAGNASTARSFAILPQDNILYLGSASANSPLIFAAGDTAKQVAEIFVASSVTGADTNSPSIGTKEYLPTRIGALSIASPITNAYSTYNSVYEAGTPFNTGFVEGILQSMVLASGQTAPSEEAHMLPTVSAVRELVDAVTVTPFSTTEAFRTLNYGLGTETFTGTAGADETFTGVPALEIFSDTGSNAYDDAASNALTNNEAIVVKTDTGYSHINPVGLGLAMQDDFTANRPAAIGFLTAGADIFKGTSLRAIIDKMLRPPLQTSTTIQYNGASGNVLFETGYQVTNDYVVTVGSVENAGPGPSISDATLTLQKTTDNIAGTSATGVESTSASVVYTGNAWLQAATSGTVTFPADFDETGEIAQANNPLVLGTATDLVGHWKLSATVPNLDASQASQVDTHQISLRYRSFIICSDFDWRSNINAGTLSPSSTYGDGNTYYAADGTSSSTTQGSGTNQAGHVWLAGATSEGTSTAWFTPITGGTTHQVIDGSETSFSNLEHDTPSTAGGAATDLATFGGRLLSGSELLNGATTNDLMKGNFYSSPQHNGGNNYYYIVVPDSLFASDADALASQLQTSGGTGAGIDIVKNNAGTAPADFFYTNQYGIMIKYIVYQSSSPGSHPLQALHELVG